MPAFRVFMRPGGWRVTDGVLEHGPYPTYEQAQRSADNLNLQLRAAEHPSFAPAGARSAEAPESHSVWEAREAEDLLQIEDAPNAEGAVERASVRTTDSPAAGPASRDGGVV